MAVPRPSIPPLVWAVAGVLAGLLGGEQLAWRTSGSLTLAVVCLTGVLAVACLVLSKWQARTLALMCASALAGVLVGALCWHSVAVEGARLLEQHGSRWVVTVTSDPSMGAFGATTEARVEQGGPVGVSVRVNWPKDAVVRSGQRVTAYGSVVASAAADERTFAAGDAGTLRVRRVVSGTWESSLLRLAGRLREWADTQVAAVPGAGGALLASVLLGERWRVAGSEADQQLRDAGLAHFESTSGYHVALLAALLEAALLGAGVDRGWRASLQAIVVLGLVLVTGGHLSPIRCWLMGLAGGLGSYVGRRAEPLAGLAAVTGGIALVSPPVIFELGFWLSVLGVLGILLFARLAQAWLAEGLPRSTAAVAGPAAVTLCAVVATTPLAASAFGVVSLVAPASNLVAVPLVLGSTTVGWVGLALCAIWPAPGQWLLHVAGALAAIMEAVAAYAAGLPGAVQPMSAIGPLAAGAWCAAVAGVWAWWPQPSRTRALVVFAGVSAAVVWLLWPQGGSAGPSIVVMDVGQGDAILVRDGPKSLLVDTGPDSAHILAALSRNHVGAIGGVVITHLHLDHYGGLAAVARVRRVPEFFVPAGTLAENTKVVADAEAATHARPRELDDGDELKVGSIELDVVSPHGPVVNAATNEASVVMVAKDSGGRVLLTGDAEAPVLEAVAARGELPPVDVLKVGHHGSAITVDEHVLDLLRPGVAVISVGAGNRYGHPKPQALAMFAGAGVRVLRTDLSGDVTIEFASGGCRVLTSGRSVVAEAPGPSALSARFSAAANAGCGTLDVSSTYRRLNPETHALAFRSEARLPHLRLGRAPPHAGTRAAHPASGRGR